MSRRPNRISQGLVFLLIVIVGVALLAYVSRPGRPQPSAAGPTTAPTADASPAKPVGTASAPRTEPPPLVTMTPTGSSVPRGTPATQPTASLDKKTPADWDKLVPADTSRPPVLAAVMPGDAPVSPSAAIEDGAKRIETGDLLAARRSFNAALVSGKLSEAEAASTKAKLAELNQTIVFSTRRFPDDPFGGTYMVQNGDALQKIARAHAISWELLGRMNDISDPRKLRAGRAIKIINGPFHAVVSKSKFEMDIWLNEPTSADAMYITTFKVGLGKESGTPIGAWLVTPGGKQKNPKFWGAGDLPPMEADDPKNPLGEFWLALTGIEGPAEGKEGYGIHGTIDPTSIGKNASLGCIRLKNEDIAMVYELLVDGKSKVYVKE